MNYLKWIYARIGQMFCFALGGGLIINGTEYAVEKPKVLLGVFFIVVGLVLRHQMIFRPSQQAREEA